MSIILRNATLNDIPFLVETIIEAEKSGTEVLSYTTIFGLSESETKHYIALMLEEEIDGCELSVSAFLLAEIDGVVAAAVCAWVEGLEGVSSSTLKGNLLKFTLPEKSFENIQELNTIIKELHIDYINDSVQIGLVYVSELARGKGIVQMLLNEKITQLKEAYNTSNDVYVQVFGNNIAAIKAYEKVGFNSVLSKNAVNVDIEKYLPSSKKILMKLN